MDQLLGLVLLGLGLHNPLGDVQGVQDEIQNTTKEIREDKKAIREEIKARDKAGIAEERAKLMEDKKARQEAMREAQAKIKENREEYQKKKQEFLDKAKTFRDESKKKAAESIEKRFNEANKHITEQLTERLKKLRGILVTIQEKGGDAVADEVAVAEEAITKAEEAVAAQAAKVYTPTVTSEATLQSDLKATKNGLGADIKALQQVMHTAERAVKAAYAVIRPTKTIQE